MLPQPAPWQCPACEVWVPPWAQSHRCGDAPEAQPPGANQAQQQAQLNGKAQPDVAVGLGSETVRTPKARSSTKARHEYTPAFEEFWSVYPLHVDKFAAATAYRNAAQRATQSQLIKGATRYAAECAANPDRSIKYAEGWLNHDRWLDEPTPVRLRPGIEPAAPPETRPEDYEAALERMQR